MTNFNTSKVSTMEKMFSLNTIVENLNLISFEVDSCLNFKEMFKGCSALTKIILNKNKEDQLMELDNEAPIGSKVVYE